MKAALSLAIVLALTAARASADSGWPALDGYRRQATPAGKRLSSTDAARLTIEEQYSYAADGRAGVLELSLLVDDRSPWTREPAGQARLVEELGKIAGILKRCGAGVSAFHVAVARFSDSLRDSLRAEGSSPYDPPPEVGVMTALAAPVRPLALLIDDGYTHAYNKSSTERLERIHPESRALRDVASVSWTIARDYQSRFHTQPSFSLTAHELVHVLGDLDHVNTREPNLMNGYEGRSAEEAGRAKSGDLFPWQCEAVRRYAP